MNYVQAITEKAGELATLIDVVATAPVHQRLDLRRMFAEKYASFLDMEAIFIYPVVSSGTVTTLKSEQAAIKTAMTSLFAMTNPADAGWGAAITTLVTGVDAVLTTHLTTVTGTAVPEAVAAKGARELDYHAHTYMYPDAVY